jgi:adenylate cyclase
MKLSLRSVLPMRPASLTLYTIVVVVGLFAVGTPVLDMIELKTYDFRFLSRGPVTPSPAVVLAAIDERSLDAEGRWPWPRSKLARLVDTLGQDGARVIGFDIGFLEPDENSELAFLGDLSLELEHLELRSERLAAFVEERRARADNDLALAKAIRDSPAAVVLGYFYHMREDDLNYRIPREKIEQHIERISPSKYPLISYESPDVDPFIKAHAPQSNIPILTDAAASCGYYSVKSDPDGVVRWMPLVLQCGEDAFPPLAVSCAWHYLGKPQMVVEVGRYGVEGIRLGKGFIPTDESGQLLINYVGPAKTFPHYSVSDILAARVPAGTFRDKIVLVGATAIGTHDLRTTPISPLFPGLEIHATVIGNILGQSFITKPRWSKVYDLLAIVVLAVLAGFALPRLGPVKAVLAAAGLFALHLGAAQYLFVSHGVWLNVVYPLLALATTSTGVTMYQYLTEQRERVKIKRTFRQYVPPLVIEEMLKNPDRLKMGGDEKVLTVLFSDLEGFTGYSERYRPNEMIELLSDYFGQMTELVFEQRGTLKEYVGDELMAIFGAPMDHDGHAHRACATALAMRDRRNALKVEWAKIGRPQLHARTGINSGQMLVGNLGSRYRFAYGVLGDQVNLGSRLEGLNKMYKTEIIIGENTANLLDGGFLLRELDRVRVKGKQKPVRIYELLETAAAGLPREKEEAYGAYGDAMQAYGQQRWKEAKELFDRCRSILPEDGPSRIMAERCRLYLETPPPEGWDGVFEHLSK